MPIIKRSPYQLVLGEKVNTGASLLFLSVVWFFGLWLLLFLGLAVLVHQWR